MYSAGISLQALEARQVAKEHALRIGLLWRLARRPRWMLGITLDAGGWALQTLALTLAPLTLVQPALAVGLVFLLAIGAGGLDVALAMSGEPFPTTMPAIFGVRLVGELPDWVSAKDVILEMLRRHGVSGGVGRIIEYHGPGLRCLAAMDRHRVRLVQQMWKRLERYVSTGVALSLEEKAS